jgi:ABC-2 type transport system permease protein
MVAQLLRLKLDLMINQFRRNPGQVAGLLLGLVAGLLLTSFATYVLVSLRFTGAVAGGLWNDVTVTRDALTVIGSVVVLGFVLVPLVFGSDSMDPRNFAAVPIPGRLLSLGLALSSLVGVPALLLTVLLLGTVVTWSRGVGQTLVALFAAVLLLATCLLASRVSTALAVFLLSTRRSREVTAFAGLVLLVLIAPLVVFVFTLDWSRLGVDLLGGWAGILGFTPLGAAWSAPGDAAAGLWGAALLKLTLAAATLGLLWLFWQGVVSRMLVSPGREAPARNYHGLGWFDRLPHSPAGAIAARSLTYWVRDSRYWVSLLMIPVVPVLACLPLALAGVPLQYLALLPVPLFCVFLGWSLHNDVAYDHTAVWLHVASGTRGSADRFGRLVPALMVGFVVIALLSLLGVSTSILLTGLGLSSFTSAQFPYPVTKPGESPFASPQSSEAAAVTVQSLTFLGSLVLSSPAIVFAALALFVDPFWNLAALISGAGIGLITLVGGLILGSRAFERRAPELLNAAMRA